jgi:TolB-like protein
MHKNFFYWLILATVVGVSGCGGRTNMESFLREEVDLTYVTRVAVVPFENISKDPFAGERVRGITITQVLAQGLFDVVDKGLVDSAFREEAVDLSKASMDAGTLKRMGQRLNVQAFLMGSIDQAGTVQRGNTGYPELAITLRLVDTNTGMIFWQASGSRTGDSMGKRLFGLGSDDEFKIALNLLRQVLSSISSQRKVKLPAAAGGATTLPAAEPGQQIEPQAEQGPEEQMAPADQGEAAPAGQESNPDAEAPMGADESLNQEVPSEPAAPAVLEEPAKEGGAAEPEAAATTESAAPLKPEAAALESASPDQENPTDKVEAQEQKEPLPVEPAAPAPPAKDAAVSPPPPPAETTSGQDVPAAPPVQVPPPLGDDEWPE